MCFLLMFDRYTVVSIFFDLQLLPLVPNIFFCFSNHQGAVFFFFLPLTLPPYILQWHHEGSNSFSEYDQSSWLRRILFGSVLFSPMRSRNFSLITFSCHFYIMKRNYRKHRGNWESLRPIMRMNVNSRLYTTSLRTSSSWKRRLGIYEEGMEGVRL